MNHSRAEFSGRRQEMVFYTQLGLREGWDRKKEYSI
jgi:hypothetical protein